ncbi:hypothetical protein B0H10DRAFT_1958705 [Mycena sp. CBHHK59/15]|nr:hypothetical protein B0H10DRAFT_1958705 [Mycena sp. CBHHK59/15]
MDQWELYGGDGPGGGARQSKQAEYNRVDLRQECGCNCELHDGPIWVLGTDGNSVFRDGAFQVLMCCEVDRSTLLYSKLSGLSRLNLWCGKATVLHVQIRSTSQNWLERLPGKTKESVSVLVDPADHQNVPHAYKLLKACILIGSLTSLDMSPTDHSTLCAFVLTGELWSSFLEPFTNSALLLSGQLSALSKFTHLAFTFYWMHGTSFISNQLYFDFQALVKSAFFCITQQQILDTEQTFYLYQLRSDVWKRCLRSKEADHINPKYFTGDMIVQNVDIAAVWKAGCQATSNVLYHNGIDIDFDAILSLPGMDLLRPNGGNIYPGIGSSEKDRSIIDSSTTTNLSSYTSNLAPSETNFLNSDCSPDCTGVISLEDVKPVLLESDAPTVFLDDFLPEPESDSHAESTPGSSAESETEATGTPVTPVISTDWLDYPLEDGSSKRLHKASIITILFNFDDNVLQQLVFSGCSVTLQMGISHIEELRHLESKISGTTQLLILRDTFVVGSWGAQSARKRLWTGDYAKFDPTKGAASTVEDGTRRALTVKIPDTLIHPLDTKIEDATLLMGADFDLINVKKYLHTWGIADDNLQTVFSAMYEPLDMTALVKLLPKHESPAFVLESATQALSEKQHQDSEKILSSMPSVYQARGFKSSYLYEQKTGIFPRLLGPVYIRRLTDLQLLPVTAVLARAYPWPHKPQCNVRHTSVRAEGQKQVHGNAIEVRDSTGLVKHDQAAGNFSIFRIIMKSTVKVTSSCPHQHKFSYSHAKKFSSQTPSTNVPVYYGLCSPVPPWKTPPAFWKYSIYPHILSAHPQNWDNLKGAPCNLSKEFVDSIAISGEELLAFDIWTGSSTAPSAKSLVPAFVMTFQNVYISSTALEL